ncbi:hypothetical protein WHR41_09071 [Cladosporium halotolerans]|uniref:Uncharacterized protein n=1 Tax=Cladosporium halotolerans TaxID=1052096 RepID=A0AB34KEM3_9PEZI
MRFSPSLALWALAGSTAAAPTTDASTLLSKRQFSTVPHDSIAFIPESYRGGAEGNAIKRFEPYLHIAHGCASYPAVSASGQVGGGLQNSGGPSSGCNDGRNGQTYVRGAFHNGRYAIMYAWYFPKDQISAGGANGGHRHDWESVVVWIDDPASANPHVFGGAASGHGGFKTTTSPNMATGSSRLQVEYFTTFPTNHELQFTATSGNDLAMIDYDTVSDAVRAAFDGYDWGNANCPFNKGNFVNNLNKAAV